MNALRAVLLVIALWLAGCVNTEKLERHVEELEQRQAQAERLTSRILARLAEALAQVEAAQKEIAKALRVEEGGR